MYRYLLKRLLFFIPTLAIITCIAFLVTVYSPGDPIDRLLMNTSAGMESPSPLAENLRMNLRHSLGLDLPLFYFSMRSMAEPDSLYRIYPKADRRVLKALHSAHGNWKLISVFYRREIELIHEATLLKSALPDTAVNSRQYINNLLASATFIRSSADDSFIQQQFDHLTHIPATGSIVNDLNAMADSLKSDYATLSKAKKTFTSYLPVIDFHLHNQFHRWLFGDGVNTRGVLRGDFGLSYASRQPVLSFILERLPWTFFFSLFSVMLAYLISIPLALKMVQRPMGSFDRNVSASLYFMYSLPVFWAASVLLLLFANPGVLYLFPASGIKPAGGYHEGITLLQKIRLSAPYLVLPTICYTYAFAALLTRLLRVSLGSILKEDYIRTAYAKGLDEATVRKKHALKNALLPAITLFAHVFPMAVGGSVIIESIFTIPGLGSGIYQSIHAQDFPVLVCIFTLTGLMTLIGYLVSDILYAVFDPRIRYK